jgi:hypothetical protein
MVLLSVAKLRRFSVSIGYKGRQQIMYTRSWASRSQGPFCTRNIEVQDRGTPVSGPGDVLRYRYGDTFMIPRYVRASSVVLIMSAKRRCVRSLVAGRRRGSRSCRHAAGAGVCKAVFPVGTIHVRGTPVSVPGDVLRSATVTPSCSPGGCVGKVLRLASQFECLFFRECAMIPLRDPLCTQGGCFTCGVTAVLQLGGASFCLRVKGGQQFTYTCSWASCLQGHLPTRNNEVQGNPSQRSR